MTDDERKALESAKITLERIINSCVHPDTAHRAIFVELDPVRKSLTKVNAVLSTTKDSENNH